MISAVQLKPLGIVFDDQGKSDWSSRVWFWSAWPKEERLEDAKTYDKSHCLDRVLEATTELVIKMSIVQSTTDL
jgi:hypothetical protein